MPYNGKIISETISGKKIISSAHPPIIQTKEAGVNNEVWKAGTILAKNGNNKLVKYDPTATDGTENPVGVLIEESDLSQNNILSYLVHGVVIGENLIVGDTPATEDDLEKLLKITIFTA